MYVILLSTLLCSFLLAPLSISYAKKMSIVDVENERSSHSGVVHRGGGILFIIFFYMGAAIAVWQHYIILEPFIMALLFSSTLLVITGWFDDYKGLSVRLRFSIQLLAVSLSVFYLPALWPSTPLFIEKIIITLAWIWFINLYNFMDGADGFSTQQGIFICLALLIITNSTNLLLAILMCSLLGFLRVNYPKAKIFMGDIGSLFLGFVLGGLLLLFTAKHWISIIDAFIITSLFGFDATYTLIKRALAKKKVLQAHREHLYQRFLIAGHSHKQLFWLAIIYNCLMLSILYLSHQTNTTVGIFLISILWLSYSKWCARP